MALEYFQVVRLKLQMQLDVNFFEKLLKENQAQEICKNLIIYQSLQLIGLWAFDLVSSRVWWEAATNNYPSLQEEFVNFFMNR